jgi:ribose 5-phosphate isomerase RpiB
MKIYIKNNEIITEYEYTDEIIEELKEKGFQEIEVPYREESNMYKYDDFEKINELYAYKKDIKNETTLD